MISTKGTPIAANKKGREKKLGKGKRKTRGGRGGLCISPVIAKRQQEGKETERKTTDKKAVTPVRQKREKKGSNKRRRKER